MKNLIILTAIVLGAVWLLRSDSDNDDASVHDGKNHVVNRAWIDKIPETMRDKIDVFIAHDDPQYGAFQHTSAFEGDYSVFQWKRAKSGNGKYAITMLQSGRQHQLRARVTRKNCKQFDMCMDLQGTPRGATRYYSMEDWVIEGNATPARIQQFIRAKLLKMGTK